MKGSILSTRLLYKTLGLGAGGFLSMAMVISKVVEITTAEQDKEKRMKRTEDNPRAFWKNIKRTNIRITGVRKEEEKKKRAEKILEEMIVENFPNMGKEIVNQVQEVQRVPYRKNPRRNTPRHILIKLSNIKYKEKIL